MMIRAMRTRGLTLVELLVVLTILGLMTGVVGLAWRRSLSPVDESPLMTARHQAIQSGIPTRVQLSDTLSVVVMPDGSVIGTGALHIDPLTGNPSSARDAAR